tara:strand:- start:293 stop:445 length:153 start_codon:yes stop_codon:yes gene_type:complete
MNWELAKYKGASAIFCKTSRCYVAFGKKRTLKELIKNLNNETEKQENINR